VPVLRDPVPPSTAAALRRAVLDLRTGEPRRRFAPVLHVGHPLRGAVASTPGVGPGLDPALRADLVAALLRRAVRGEPATPLVWLTRTGGHAWHDADAAWLEPAARAHAEAGRSLTFVVVTRRGWWDPRSGAQRTWARLRARS
jgi:hypothetical protein